MQMMLLYKITEVGKNYLIKLLERDIPPHHHLPLVTGLGCGAGLYLKFTKSGFLFSEYRILCYRVVTVGVSVDQILANHSLVVHRGERLLVLLDETVLALE